MVFEAMSVFLGGIWDFFTEVTVPGFDFSFGALYVGLFLAVLGLRFLFAMFGINIGVSNVASDAEKAASDAKWKNRNRIGF